MYKKLILTMIVSLVTFWATSTALMSMSSAALKIPLYLITMLAIAAFSTAAIVTVHNWSQGTKNK